MAKRPSSTSSRRSAATTVSKAGKSQNEGEDAGPEDAEPPKHDSLPTELVAGYAAFRHKRFPKERRHFLKLAKGQHPNALVIGCVDSRVPLEIIFDVAPGDIFVVRNIAALVPQYDEKHPREGTSAAIEYAVKALKVAHIVVVGHQGCGGVEACAKGTRGDKPEIDWKYVGDWVSQIGPIAGTLEPPPREPAAFADYCEKLCKATIRGMLSMLRSYPWVKDSECEGKLTLHGAYFKIEQGELLALDQHTNEFETISGSDASA